MNYISGLKEAIRNTENFDLTHNLKELQKGYSPDQLKASIIQVVRIIEKAHGYSLTSDLAEKCFQIHPIAKKIFNKIGIESEITIGNVVVDGKDYYSGASLESMTNELISHQNKDSFFNGHCWLTLIDGTIIDFTHYSDRTNPKKPEQWINNILIIDTTDYNKNEYHVPYFLGDQFLEKTGCTF
jgi:hypothetical protein